MGKRAAHLPVVLLHGVGGAACVWGRQLAGLRAAGFSPVALDLPGYGAREPVHELTFAGLAGDVEGAIAARGLERPALLGHSLGGMLVQTLLRRRPDAYRAAVLACTSPAFGKPDGEWQRRFIAARLSPLDAGNTMADLAQRLVAAIMAPGADPAGRALAIAAMSAVAPSTYRAAVCCLLGFDERANLAHIRVPCLCLACERDPIAPSPVMERMAAAIPGAHFLCLPRLGHLPNLEAPVAFTAAIIDFLSHAEKAGPADGRNADAHQ